MASSQSSWCSLRIATFILAALGTITNLFVASKLYALWFSFKITWDAESEWEGLSWRVDGTRALGAVVCAYFFVGGLASVVGLIGVIKRRQSNVRLFRDYSIADLAFAFTCAILFAFASSQSVIRASICEEISRQPDLLRNLSDQAGLNVENCESFLDKAIVGVVMTMFVVLFLRLQYTLTVLNYYNYLRKTSSQPIVLPMHSRQSSSSHRVLVVEDSRADVKQSENLVWVYQRVQMSKSDADRLGVRQAVFSSPSSRSPSPPRSGGIQLPVVDGEAPWSKGGHVRRMTMDEYEKYVEK